jgi:hypothetical protein
LVLDIFSNEVFLALEMAAARLKISCHFHTLGKSSKKQSIIGDFETRVESRFEILVIT